MAYEEEGDEFLLQRLNARKITEEQIIASSPAIFRTTYRAFATFLKHLDPPQEQT
jgi:hypothetical protein